MIKHRVYNFEIRVCSFNVTSNIIKCNTCTQVYISSASNSKLVIHTHTGFSPISASCKTSFPIFATYAAIVFQFARSHFDVKRRVTRLTMLSIPSLYFLPLLLQHPLQAGSSAGGGDSVTVGNLLVVASFFPSFPDKDAPKYLEELVGLLGPLLLVHLLLLCTATSWHF